MKIYLTSFAARSIDKINFDGKKRVAFITTAANPYENKSFVEEDRIALESKGLELTDVDLNDVARSHLASLFQTFEIIFVCGGNTFYLLEKMKSSGFDKEIHSLLKKGIMYIGSSAGSIVLCPNIKYVSSLDDPNKAPTLENYEGLNLINCFILPHYGREKYATKLEQIMNEHKQLLFEPLRDDELILVENKHYTRI